MNLLFEENIETYNLIQLTEWIRKCRTTFVQSDKLVYKEDYSRFANDVFIFYEEYKSFISTKSALSKSRVFSQAAKLAILPRPFYKILTGDGHELDVTDGFSQLQLENHMNFKSIISSIDRESKRADEYSMYIKNFLYARENLRTVLEYLLEKEVVYEINILEKKAELVGKLSKNFIPNLKKVKWKGRTNKIGFEKDMDSDKKRKISDFLIPEMRKNQINKNLYYTYISKLETDLRRVFSKSFFANIGFYLGLSLSEMEELMNKEGYTISYSQRKDDEILANCFRCFFPREYANALLFKAGYDTLDIRK